MAAPPIRPPVLSYASMPVTKYLDLIATQSSGPLTVLVSPGSRLPMSIRSASVRRVTTARAWWFSSMLASVFARVGPIPTSRVPPLGPDAA